jgi:hypothetical protein
MLTGTQMMMSTAACSEMVQYNVPEHDTSQCKLPIADMKLGGLWAGLYKHVTCLKSICKSGMETRPPVAVSQ